MKYKVVFTTHAINKIKLLKQHGFTVTEKQIKEVALNPDNLDLISDDPNLIASKDLDKRHILRVVYKIENGIMRIITFYPAEKGRYY